MHTPNGKKMSYYGCREMDFKARFTRNMIMQSFKILFKRHQTELPKLVWQLKGEGRDPVLSLNGPQFANPNRTAAAQCTSNCAWQKNWNKN